MLKNLTFDHILNLSKKEDKIKIVQLIVSHLDERTLSCIKISPLVRDLMLI